MADKQPIVNIFGISGPSGNPVQSPATLYARDDRRWNSFLRQYAVWPTTGNENRSFTIYRIFDAPYTGTYYIRSSVDNSGTVFINDLKVNGTTQTVERHHWWWWGGWWGGYGYWNGYGGYWGWGGYRTTDWATVPPAYPITLGRGINQLRFEVSNGGDVAGFGMTIADTNGNIVWDTRSTAVVSEFTQTCGRYSITSPIDADIVAYLWGGGGGGGGMDAGSRGGDGAPGEFHKVNFSVEIGDVIEVVVGDGGRAGSSNSGSAPGGLGGASRINLTGFGSFSGANGSAAGPSPYSGGGGGGGGASLVLVNEIPVAVAGGGGGAGGAGNDGNSAGVIAIRNALTAYPDQAQIFSGARAVEVSGTLEPLNGQRGQGKNGDGGGAGGGGGGWGGGSGGTVRGGDSSSYGGQTGGNYPFNQIFKHTAGNISFVVPSSVTSIQLLSAVAGGGGGGSGNITQGAGGGGEGARAKNLNYNVVPGRLYEICVGEGGLGGNTLAGLYSGQGTITNSNLVINAGRDGSITSIRDTVTNTYLLKLGGGRGGTLTSGGAGGTVVTNTSNPGSGSVNNGASGLSTTTAVGASGAGPAAGRQSGADALTETVQGSDFGCGSAGAGSDKVSIFAVDPNDQTKPQVVAKGFGGKGANGAILIRWEDDQRLGEDGELFAVSNTSWNSFLNSYGVWRKDNATQATVLRGLDTAYSGTYKIRAAATGTLMVYIDDVQVLTTTNTSAGDITSADIVLSRGIHQIRFDINSSASVKGFAVSLSDSADKLYWDTRDNIGTNPPGQNMRYYVPPYARGGTAGQEGSNGAVALEIYPRGLSNVKVGGQWRNITTAAVKVSGIWRDIASIFVKVNGRWQPSGSAGDLTTLIFNQQFENYGTDDRVGLPAPPGGGGRRCKIICTKLHDLGYLPDHIYAADELFGEHLRENDPEAYYGYIRWASVVVDWMEKDGPQCMFWIRDKEKRGQAQRNLAISWARRIATPWAQHMAYKMGVEKEDSRAGRAIMKTGLVISRLIGKFSKADKPTKSVATGYAMWAVFGLFYILAGLKDKK